MRLLTINRRARSAAIGGGAAAICAAAAAVVAVLSGGPGGAVGSSASAGLGHAAPVAASGATGATGGVTGHASGGTGPGATGRAADPVSLTGETTRLIVPDVIASVPGGVSPADLARLRRLTGVPCPMCGSTTVFMEAGAGHWTEALGANPFTVLAFLVFLAAPLGLIDPVATWADMPARRRNIGLGVILALSWVWQLHRFGFVLSGTKFS